MLSSAVDEEEIGHRIVSDEEIHVSVIVDVGGDYAQPLAAKRTDPSLLADVGEMPSSVIAIQVALLGLEYPGRAVVGTSICGISNVSRAAAIRIRRPADFQAGIVEVLCNIQVQLAIIVVVEPNCAGRPSGFVDSALRSHIRKGAVAVVVIQYRRTITCKEQVRIAVPIVIADRNAHPKNIGGQASLLGNV